ncbi:plasmid stabilization system protein ParE [Rhizobium leguminosarum]|nr:plasmid stabilization system protein ParE [Rhizobium leguminosarum]
MSFKLSVEAEDDIIAIAEQGVRLFGAGQAKRYHDELFALLDLIAAIHASHANGMRSIHPSEFIRSKRISSFIGLKTMRKFS